MKTFWLLYKSEAKLSMREMSSVIFGIFVPVGIICLMAFMDPDNHSLNTNFVAVSTVGICSAGVMGLPASIVFLSGTQDLKAISSNTDQPGTVTFRPSVVLFYDQYCFHAVDIRRFDHVFPIFLCRSLGTIYFCLFVGDGFDPCHRVDRGQLVS